MFGIEPDRGRFHTAMELNVLTLRHVKTLLNLAFRKLWAPKGAEPAVAPGEGGMEEPLINVRELIERSSIDDLNRAAESYFSSLDDWEYHLSKPFSSMGDAPGLLINFAVMIPGLRLAPGLRLLDFGAGSGWTSRFLTQLGCEVILLDVSKTALEIAAELYRRQPVIGDRPAPTFLEFDGRRIDLPDGSVDRILSFDAFHHTPNPFEVLAEFARVLVPGGVAAFSEPGPEHSKSPQSQSEMRNYGVVENDVDIHAIARAAREAGFADLKLAAYNVPPYHISLKDYEDLLSGGENYLRWAESTRAFLGNVRSFFLLREGEELLDSRHGVSLVASIEISVAAEVSAGSEIEARAVVRNAGRATWLPSGRIPGGVSLGCHLFAADGRLEAFDHHWSPLSDPSRRVEPGETVEIAFRLPPLPVGRFTLEFDCVADRVAWFAQTGSHVTRATVEVIA